MAATNRKRRIARRTRKRLRGCIQKVQFSNNQIAVPEISQKSMSSLKCIWKSICENVEHNIIFRPLDSTQDMTVIRESNMYSSIPNKIREAFEKINYAGVYLKTKLPGNRTAHIYIVEDARHKSHKRTFAIYLRYIVAWLRFASSIASPHCATELRAYLLLSDAKKFMPDFHSDTVDVIHANTAFTTSCSSQNTIFLFRREEWFKVFMHETFHCMGLDFSAGSEQDDSNDRMRALFKALEPSTDVRLYETFCEMWAELSNLMFCLFTTREGKCLPFSERRFRKALFREQLFSIYQSNKLLCRAGFTYSELFAPPSSKPAYKENTQAFSYYVLKSVLIWNVDDFIQWCEKWNNGKTAPIQFPSNQVSNYCDFVETLSKSASYKAATESHIVMLYSGDAARKNAILNTLRMTAIDPFFFKNKKTQMFI